MDPYNSNTDSDTMGELSVDVAAISGAMAAVTALDGRHNPGPRVNKFAILFSVWHMVDSCAQYDVGWFRNMLRMTKSKFDLIASVFEDAYVHSWKGFPIPSFQCPSCS